VKLLTYCNRFDIESQKNKTIELLMLLSTTILKHIEIDLKIKRHGVRLKGYTSLVLIMNIFVLWKINILINNKTSMRLFILNIMIVNGKM